MRLRKCEGRTLLGTVAVLGTAAALVAGCGGSSPGPAQVPTVSLSRAAEVSSAAPGYKVAMTLHQTVANQGSIDMNANGSFSPAAHAGAMTMQMNPPAAAGSGTLQMQIVLAAGTIYIKLPPALASKIPGGKPWMSINLAQAVKAAGIPGLGSLVSSTSSLNDPDQYLDFLRATADGTIENLGQATVNGLRTTHYHAEADLSKLPDVVPAADRHAVQQLVAALQRKGAATQMPIDAWIDGSHLVRRLQMAFTEALPTGQSVAISLTENFLGYGPQPAPAVPSSGQTVDLLSLTRGVI